MRVPASTEAADATPAEAPAIVRVPVRATLRLPAVWSGTLAFALYVAIEVSAGLWAFLLLTEGRGLSAAVAGGCVSAYWGSLFVGRVVQGVVAERLGAGLVLRASLAGMAVGALLIAVPGPAVLAVAGLVVVGFAAAPVFPLLTLTTAERVGAAHADRAIGLQIGASGIGAALVPAGLGVLIGNTSVQVLGSALLVLALALIVLYEWGARRSTGRPTAHPVPAQTGGEGQPDVGAGPSGGGRAVAALRIGVLPAVALGLPLTVVRCRPVAERRLFPRVVAGHVVGLPVEAGAGHGLLQLFQRKPFLVPPHPDVVVGHVFSGTRAR